MRVHSSDDDIYIGRGAGSRLKDDISGAKHSLKIISPYLSPSYVEAILKLAKQGVNVTLITANDIETDKSGKYSGLSHKDIIRQKRRTDNEAKEKRSKIMLYSGLFFIIPFILFFTDFWYLGIALAFLNAIVFWKFKSMRIYTYSYYSPIKIKVVPDEYNLGEIDNLDELKDTNFHLIHAKVFVIDDRVAYVGSVNFTYRAFNKSYENIVRIKSHRAISEISKEVDRLYKDEKACGFNLQSWGRGLYGEPPN